MNAPKKLTEKMTCREMCEAIASKLDGVTAREIFELSPTGELFHIPILYEYLVIMDLDWAAAKTKIGQQKEL